MADREYIGTGASGLKGRPSLASAILKMRDKEKQTEQKVAAAQRAVKGNRQQKMDYLEQRATDLEAMAVKMDQSKNQEAARTYRRAAAFALKRRHNLSLGGSE